MIYCLDMGKQKNIIYKPHDHFLYEYCYYHKY
jgi:hypothetical protein